MKRFLFVCTLFLLALNVLRPVLAQSATLGGFSPAIARKGSLVQITGSGLRSVSKVAFHGVTAKFTVNSDTLLTALVPAAASGAITLTTPSGTLTSKDIFTVGKVETVITRLIPISGSAGTLVKITGIGFTGATRVRFGSVPSRFIVVSDHEITVIVPRGAKSARITILTPGGPASSAAAFDAL